MQLTKYIYMQNNLPPDLVDSIVTTVGVALGYLLRWIQTLLTKKSKNNETRT